MISECFVDEVHIVKKYREWKGVSVAIIPPDKLSKEPKLVVDYPNNEDIAKVVEVLVNSISTTLSLKNKIIAMSHLEDYKYSLKFEDGSYLERDLVDLKSFLETIALLVEKDLKLGK